MIQIYSRENTDYSNNGDIVLFPEECTLKAQLNGAWKISMSHPLDDEKRWKHIEPEAVLAVPTFMGGKQLFRISDKIEKNDYEVSVSAYPIFWDAADEHVLVDVRPTGKTGQEALDIMTGGTKYSGKSNISAGNTAYFVRRNLLDAINGENEPTFVKTWGGEVLYDNYEVIINDRVGGDYGYEVRYGKNMENVRHTIDMSNVITRIFPVAHNGYTLSSNYVDSPLKNNYVKTYAREIVFSEVKMRADANADDEVNGITVCDTQEELDAVLIAKCNERYAAGVDLMKVTIAVDMIELSQTEEYKDFKDLESASLGDTVHCYNYKLGITTEQRIIELEWDCIENKIKSLVLGDYEETFIDKTSSIVNRVESAITKDGNVMAERIQGIINGIKAQLKIQSTAAQKVEGRVFCVEDTDENSDLYGCMVWGTQGLQIATKRTEDGKDWDWTTAATAKGMVADVIIAGLLSDKTGRNWWNLDTGEFHLESYPTADDVAVLFAISENEIKTLVEQTYETKENATNKYGTLQSSITQNANSITAEVSRATGAENNLSARIEQTAESVSLKVSKGDVVSEINQSAEEILLKGNRVLIEANNCTLQKDGTIALKNGKFSGEISGSIISLDQGDVENVLSVCLNSLLGGFTTIQGRGVICFPLSEGYAASMHSDGFYISEYTGNASEGTWNLSTDCYYGRNMSVSGTKSRNVDTDTYGRRNLYCYETPTPMFGDIGEGQLDETGKCYIFIDDIFSETIDTDCTYQVFLQPYGKGECYVAERTSSYFIVEGTKELSFGWEIKAVQRDYDTMRLEEYEEPVIEENLVVETEVYLNSLVYEEDTVAETETYLNSLVFQEDTVVETEK